MKTIRMGPVAVAAMCLLTASAVAQSPVGAWKGKINMKMPAMPATADPKMKAMVAQQFEMIKKMTLNLTMSKNNTYTVNTSGGPPQAGKQEDKGTWKQSGKTITMTSSKKDGPGAGKPQSMTFSADGKTMTMTIPGPGGAQGGSIIFKKG